MKASNNYLFDAFFMKKNQEKCNEKLFKFTNM